MSYERIEWSIEGRVQGVGFREATLRKALELGVKGWVRNTPEGTVEIVAEATSEIIEQFRQWCEEGPTQAVVHNVRAIRRVMVAHVSFTEFEIRYST